MKRIAPHGSMVVSILASALFASVGLIGGVGLQSIKGQLIAFTPLLVALPAMNAMAGDYANLITAHIGDPEMQKQTMRKLFIALAISLPISIFGVTAISLFIAALKGYTLSLEVSLQYLSLIAASLLTVVLFTLLAVYLLNKALQNSELNSDDVLIPSISSLSSIIAVITFALIVLFIH